MKLHALSSSEELLEKVDVLCVPSSKEKAETIYQEVLQKVVHEDSLPSFQNFSSLKSPFTVFYGQWNGHKIKVVYFADNGKLTEASAYALVKKMAIKVKSDCQGAVGLWVQHMTDQNVLESAFSGWTAGQYDLGMYKLNEKEDEKNKITEVKRNGNTL